MPQSSLEILLDMRRKAKALLDADTEAVEALQRGSGAISWSVNTASDSLASSPVFIAFVATVKDEVRKDFLQSIERNEDGFREQLRRVLRLP